MCGVIIDGVQWERCNGCGEWVRIEELRYETPSEQFKYGRDLCSSCASKSARLVDWNPEMVVIHLERP